MNSLFGKIRRSAAAFGKRTIDAVNPLYGKLREGASVALRKISNTAGDVGKALDSTLAHGIAEATGTEGLRNDLRFGARVVHKSAGDLRNDLERETPKKLTVPSKPIINLFQDGSNGGGSGQAAFSDGSS